MKIKDLAKAARMVVPGIHKWEEYKAIRSSEQEEDLKALDDGAMDGVFSTPWGHEIMSGYRDYLQEYPRPQMVRVYKNKNENTSMREAYVVYSGEGYFNLNGLWQYAIQKKTETAVKFYGEILVPFSPETEIGMVARTLQPDEYLFYRKMICCREKEENQRILLHFGAVDQCCEVYLNGVLLGKHIGGYLPFTFEMTNHMVEGDNELMVKVWDETNSSWHSRGKQKLKPGGMFYHAQSGIWQTVWMETVPEEYLREVKITPLFDQRELRLQLFREGGKKPGGEVEIEVLDGNFVVTNVVTRKETIRITLPEPVKSWTPQSPFLYHLNIRLASGDQVKCYFAMRIFTKEADENGVYRLCLNHQPFFQNGVLSQGYWADSLMTAPDDAAYIYDIEQMKEAGFNMIRVHCKIESLRFYYHCDRLGMLVWQDMVNGGNEYSSMRVTYTPTVIPGLDRRRDNCYKKLGRASLEGRRQWQRECVATIHLLYNSPCISAWVLFNEGWGQFDAAKAVEMVRGLDKTRMIDHASGWFDQGAGDLHSIHRYFEELEVEKDPYPSDRAKVISEYGGFAYRIPNHVYGKGLYSYKTYYRQKDFAQAFTEIQERIRRLEKEGLSASVYTQVSDIEEEMNGLLTFDRRVNKLKK